MIGPALVLFVFAGLFAYAAWWAASPMSLVLAALCSMFCFLLAVVLFFVDRQKLGMEAGEEEADEEEAGEEEANEPEQYPY